MSTIATRPGTVAAEFLGEQVERQVVRVDDLKVKIFADGADKAGITNLAQDRSISGFTTNPTLMRAAGVTNYETFAREILAVVPDRPISFEVFADEPNEMYRQALKISSWGPNVYVKIPVTDTKGVSTSKLVRRLADKGIQLNVTALMTLRQVETVIEAVAGGPSSCISIFAGRIADSGRDPVPIMAEAARIIHSEPNAELIWASPREVLNIIQADQIGCDIITVTHALLKKLSTVGRDLDEFSLDTVRMFYRDAQHAGYSV